jgi:hypothetical protein
MSTSDSVSELSVTNGPDRADLLRAVTNPDQHLHVIFATEAEPLEAHLDAIEEVGDEGATFGLKGHIASGKLKGAVFSGIYDSGSRTGTLMLRPG